MKKILIPFLLLLCLTAHSQTQRELNQDAKSTLAFANSVLLESYQKICSKTNDTIFLQNMMLSHIAWKQYRDAQVRMMFPDVEGSILPMCYLSYLTELTLERISVLQIWIDGTDECDVCAGTIPKSK